MQFWIVNESEILFGYGGGNMKSKWTSNSPKEFVVGDIICNRAKQDFLRLVLYVDDIALWVTGFVHCALTEGMERHPIFPIYFSEIENDEPLLRLGNLNDYLNFVPNIQEEIKTEINNIENYYT